MKYGMKILTLERKASRDKWGEIVTSTPESILGQIVKREVVNTANPKESIGVKNILYTMQPVALADIVEGLEVVADLGHNKYELGAG